MTKRLLVTTAFTLSLLGTFSAYAGTVPTHEIPEDKPATSTEPAERPPSILGNNPTTTVVTSYTTGTDDVWDVDFDGDSIVDASYAIPLGTRPTEKAALDACEASGTPIPTQSGPPDEDFFTRQFFLL